MRFSNAFVPAGAAWSSPFAKWQGSLSSLHTVHMAADVTTKGLARAGIEAKDLDTLVYGWTVPGPKIFYGGPWLAGLIGAPGITGAMVSQACATSAAAVAHAAAQVELGGSEAAVVVAADKCSNGPHLLYPNPAGPGGKGDAEDWVWDNFSFDPWAKNSMIQTAENVAKEAGVSREEQDALTQVRYDQYREGHDSGLLAEVLLLPYEVNPSGRKVIATLTDDEGVFPTTAEGLAKLRPVMPDGTITFGSQTHPADGAAGLVVATKDKAKAWSGGAEPAQLLSYGTSRVEKGFMAKAVVPAARQALDHAGLKIGDMSVIKTHNPFAVNDIYFARQMGIAAEDMNPSGSSLIFGHPQGPTGARLIAEGLAEVRRRGGGYLLFAGCAAGDTSAACVFKV